jgi:hypothetical protein
VYNGVITDGILFFPFLSLLSFPFSLCLSHSTEQECESEIAAKSVIVTKLECKTQEISRMLMRMQDQPQQQPQRQQQNRQMQPLPEMKLPK